MLGPLSNHTTLAVPGFACHVPVPAGWGSGFSSLLPIFPQVKPGELQSTSTAQRCAFNSTEIAQPLPEQNHTGLSQAKAPAWDIPTFLLREATQVSPAAFTHYRLVMSYRARPKLLKLNRTSSHVYSMTM